MQTKITIFKYIYRYCFMRFLIPFLCLILLASCHNKSDLKRIAELEEENAELKEKYKKIYFNKKLLEDSILGGGAFLDILMSCLIVQRLLAQV